MVQLPHAIYGRWVHSNEEDEGELEVYRPEGYSLPPVRGRTGFELRDDGAFLQHGIGRADKPEEREGRWEAEAPDRARVRFPDPDVTDLALELVSVEPDKLVVRRSAGTG